MCKEKVKHLYFWNDLSIIYPDKNNIINYIEIILDEFFSEITYSNEYLNISVITNNNFSNWKKKVLTTTTTTNPIICVGTRPNIVFNNCYDNMISIYPVRERDCNGFTSNVHISYNDRNRMIHMINNNKTVTILEDVIVCGVTMKTLLDIIMSDMFFVEKVYVKTFIYNKNSVMNLIDNSLKGFDFNGFIEMYGRSIIDSTCLCFSDVLYGNIKGMNLSESREKLSLYFGDRVNDFLELLELCKTLLFI